MLKWIVLLFGGGCLIVVIGSIATCGAGAVGLGKVAQKAEEERKAAQAAEEAAPVSDLRLESLVNDFKMGSTTTKIQQDEIFKGLKGKKVQWTAKVYDITDQFGTLKIQTKAMGFDNLTVFVLIKESERQKALHYKENDSITFVGILDDHGMMGTLNVVRATIVE